jgi:hypothetical protein
MRRFLLVLTMMALFPATAGAATLHATPSNFASTFSGAAGGDTILLASGSYGSWNGGAKASTVTVAPESGASVSFSGGNFGTTVRNITVQGVTYTGSVCINPPTGVKMGLVLDGVTFGNVGQGCGEGRLTIRGGGTASVGGNGVQVKNSTFGPGGCSDGIQDDSKGTEIGPGNEFKSITQSCSASSAHVDSIQPYDSNYIWIHDNNFHDNEQGIMSPDGLSTGYLIENNVIHTSTGYPCMHIGDSTNGTIRHNVCRNGGIRVYGGNQNTNSRSMVIQDNVDTGSDVSACTGCTIDHNLRTTQVTYTGGTGRCAYATASPKGTASDGTDIGLNDCGTSPPPPPPPPPPTDHTPVAAFTASPEPSAPGQSVTFDASASTCEDTPCTYHWHDIGGGGDWPLGPDGKTSTFAFQSTHPASAPVMAELVVTDADGDVAKVEHDHVVSTAPPPPPPPPAPTAEFTWAPAPITVDPFTLTRNTTCGSPPCTYDWTITLKVTDSTGRTDTVTHTLAP